MNTDGWTLGSRETEKDRGRIRRQGWKRHQKIREKMENWGPSCLGKITSKTDKSSRVPDTQLRASGWPALPQGERGDVYSFFVDHLLPLLWKEYPGLHVGAMSPLSDTLYTLAPVPVVVT